MLASTACWRQRRPRSTPLSFARQTPPISCLTMRSALAALSPPFCCFTSKRISLLNDWASGASLRTCRREQTLASWKVQGRLLSTGRTENCQQLELSTFARSFLSEPLPFPGKIPCLSGSTCWRIKIKPLRPAPRRTVALDLFSIGSSEDVKTTTHRSGGRNWQCEQRAAGPLQWNSKSVLIRQAHGSPLQFLCPCLHCFWVLRQCIKAVGRPKIRGSSCRIQCRRCGTNAGQRGVWYKVAADCGLAFAIRT